MTSGVSGGKKPTLCRYYLNTGSCIYGDECQFFHQNPRSGVGFQKPFANGPSSSSQENQAGPFDMMGNNGDQYFNATFEPENGGADFIPFPHSRPISRTHRNMANPMPPQGMKPPFGPPPQGPPGHPGPPGPKMDGQMQRPDGPGHRMERPNQMMDGYGPRMNGPVTMMENPNPNGGPPRAGPRMDSMATDFAALNLSIPSSKGPNPIANEFIPKNGPLTHSASSPNFSTFSDGMTTDGSGNSHMMNNPAVNHMSQMGGPMGMPPPSGPMMPPQSGAQMSNTPPPTHLSTTGYTASPNHSPHLSPSNSPLMLRRTASPITPLKNTTPKKSANTTIQENVGGTTYFYSPEDFTPQHEGAALPNFSVFPSLPPHIAHMTVKKNMPQFFMPDELRVEILNRHALTMAQIDTSANPDIPVEVDTYHNLFPLEPPPSNPMQKSNRFSYPTTCYKAVNTKDGLTYCLRRVHGFRLSNTKCMSIIDMWKKMYHPNIVQLREVFTTKAFGDNSIVFVYDYYAGAETLMAHHFHNSGAMNSYHGSMDGSSRSFNPSHGGAGGAGTGGKGNVNGPRQHAGLLPESLIWAYVVQLSSALRAIHAAGLACRTMDPTKIIIYGKSRLRLNCVGILDVLTFDSTNGNPMAVMPHYQQDDLLFMGRVVLALACNTVMAIQRDSFQNSMELIARNYSADLKNLFLYLLANQTRPRSINDIMPMIGARFYTQLDSAQLRSDVIETELAKEVENGRVLRLISKFGIINERPEFNMDPQWSETGDRYMLKLFRDYLFHQVDENGAPWIDMAHIVQCLNKLDAGVPEKICLMSRDEHSVLVVSYAELKQNFEQSFNDLLSARHQNGAYS
ncbi:PAN2-PAN3 deadenylation complex subunit pan3-like isoform X1 [Argopecten irradians]|uniref:PAN2-PAN3 deadenylation complex subunit pan3-like isoform X1 n=2 Tax=Argopecten irradians TaxID=31199 RepID=UPI00370FE3C1